MTLRSFAPMLAAAMLLAPAAAGQDDRSPNALTREEIEQGWIQLFDGESTFGWTVTAEQPGGTASVEDGVLTVTGPARISTTTQFGPFELEFRARFECDRPDRQGSMGLSWRRGDGFAGITHPIDRAEDDDGAEFLDHRVVRTPDGDFSGSVSTGPLSGKVELRGGLGQEEVHLSPITFSAPEGGTLRLSDVRLRPGGMESIFNGKDLTGWSVLDGGQSVYSVTDEGALNVKNGRGDIQTEGQYDDFVLQLDVYSNGEHLNSGIFLRALPGQFWSGYESQIRNEFEGDDRTKPIDFGTGAIYRRQAARKVVADDFEWFTKTIVAHDNHFAVWVDGYQVSDWTDDRPPADNGRNGYKAAPGVISIQGHDPTTDLSFRNIRIAELPGD